jgi:hypothetical protein
LFVGALRLNWKWRHWGRVRDPFEQGWLVDVGTVKALGKKRGVYREGYTEGDWWGAMDKMPFGGWVGVVGS